MLTDIQTVYDSIICGVIVLDSTMLVKASNHKACKMIGYSSADLIGMNCRHIFQDLKCESMYPSITCVQEKKFCFHQSNIKTKKGVLIPVDIVVIPLLNPEQLPEYIIFFVPTKSQDRQKRCFTEYGLIGENGLLSEVCYQIQNVAPTNASVLILGETGTGKEVVARIIHKVSNRSDKALLSVNCAALAESLLESELFGHTKGAFTGADKERKGLFESANGGTVFLDEIGEITPSFQAKLLRVLQSGEFQRVGSSEIIKTDVRIITATNRNLRQLTKEGGFREDLYYRLCVFPITLPPLRERRSDLPQLINHFIKEFNQSFRQEKIGMSEVALTMLVKYRFPGNIRELRNIIEHAYIVSKDIMISPWDLPQYVQEEVDINIYRRKEIEHEDKDIIQLLTSFNGNKAKTAKYLGISRKTLYNRLKKSELDTDEE